jgi:hypothetical protein
VKVTAKTIKAIRRTAEFFEEFPARYSWIHGTVCSIRKSKEPMCPLAAIGAFLRIKGSFHGVAEKAFGMTSDEVYDEIYSDQSNGFLNPSVSEVVAGLRAWADRLEAKASTSAEVQP